MLCFSMLFIIGTNHKSDLPVDIEICVDLAFFSNQMKPKQTLERFIKPRCGGEGGSVFLCHFGINYSGCQSSPSFANLASV